jgi:ATPase subunit of ABC transporter with duplicated ATPase domains
MNKQKIKQYQKQYRETHKKEAKIYQAKYRNLHKKEKTIRDRIYRANHKTKAKQYRNKYYKVNRKNLIEQSKNYYNNHKKEIAIKRKKYYSLRVNKEKINNYYKYKRKTDINFKIKHYLRVRIGDALRGKTKSLSTIKLIGCSIEQLKKHLESKFKQGMSWSNHGKWHIDHIKPCASFNLSKESEQIKCFNWKNLQPLWAEENLIKNRFLEV